MNELDALIAARRSNLVDEKQLAGSHRPTSPKAVVLMRRGPRFCREFDQVTCICATLQRCHGFCTRTCTRLKIPLVLYDDPTPGPYVNQRGCFHEPREKKTSIFRASKLQESLSSSTSLLWSNHGPSCRDVNIIAAGPCSCCQSWRR